MKNGRCKFNHIDNNIKCEWIKQSIKKADVRLHKNNPSVYCVTRGTL